MDIFFKNNKQKKYIFILKSNIFCNYFFVLLLFSILQNNLINSLSYPKSITLLNGNIFVIHQDGITIYDSSLRRVRKNVIEFNSEEKIDNKDKLTKITISRFENEYIVCIILATIHVFDIKGNLLYKEENKTITELMAASSTYSTYTLLPIKKVNNEYTYMIGFIKNDFISLYFFKFVDNEDSKINTLLYTKKPFRKICYDSNNYEQSCPILNNALTCELMSNSEGNNIYCFFGVNIAPQSVTLAIINSEPDYDTKKIGEQSFLQNDAKGLKSAISPDRKKCLICMNFPDRTSNCTVFSVDNLSFSTVVKYEVECGSEGYTVNVEYMRETEQYVFSCSNYEGKLTATLFDKDFNHLGETFKLADSGKVFGYSIVYSYSKGNYFAVSDINNENGQLQFIEISNTTKINSVVEPIDPESDEPIIPTTLITTIPTTILTTIPTTILSTMPTIKLTTIPTTILTTILTTLPSTIITSIIETIPFICNLEKCKSCNEESSLKNLCLECNKDKHYYPITPSIIYNPLIYNNNYIDCYNNSTKPTNFYFNKSTEFYEPCYKTCATCEYGGDGNQNNCTTCDVDHMKEPENLNSTNCIALCSYYYYISFGQYKCTILPQCPEEYSLLIRDKRKCVNSCTKDLQYKFQYNGECIESCPEETIIDENNNLCKIKDIQSCTESTTEFELYDFLKEGGVEKIAKTYANEFNYTNRHISLFKNEVYSIMLYKDVNCVAELGLPMPQIDFGSCYQNIQSQSNLKNKDLIIGIIEKKNNKRNNPITSYAFYNPDNGEKLNSELICKENFITVKENIKSLLNDSYSNIDSILYLTGQNINVFNKSSEFYTSICYHFDSPCDKDVALRDRLLVYYPNITLCDAGCKNIGINLTAMTVICECKFKNLTLDELENEDNIYKDVVNEVHKILSQVNLDVMECYKDLFKYEFFISNTGGIIILIMILIQIVTLIIYYIFSLFFIKKYIYSVTENYLLYLNKSPMVNIEVINFNKKNEKKKDNDDNSNSNQNLQNPPKKSLSTKINKAELFDLKNNIKKSNANNKKKRKSTKSIDNCQNSKLLNSKYPINYKKVNHKSKLYSFNKLEKMESSIKSNNESLIDFTFEKYLSVDLEDMHFHDVVILDQRLFFDYLCDKLKKKQLILQLFCVKSPLKPITIKLLLLFLDIEICFVVNAMFINEDYVSNLFHSKKEEKFTSFIPRSINRFIYTIFASIVVSYFIGCIFVEENKIKGIFKRESKNINNLKYQIILVMKEINIRYNIFIIIVVAFSCFSWFYISCFNNIYPHMKIEWIKSSIFIIILIHFLSIFVILVETLLRFISFEIQSERLYRASLWLG